MKKKFYVVWEGVTPGIYTSWTDCQLQTKGYPGARYASFKSREEAEEAYSSEYGDVVGKKKKSKVLKTELPEDTKGSWSVDAACSGNPGKMEYRGVHTEDGSEIFHQGPFIHGTNNIGEFLALVHALALLKKSGDTKRVIYSDSKIAMLWVRKRKCNTKLKRTRATEKLYIMIHRAEEWLKKNKVENPLKKWETKAWGEIPADFGRK